MRKTAHSAGRCPRRPVSFISPPIRPAAGHFPEDPGLRYWPIRVVSGLLPLPPSLPSEREGCHSCQLQRLQQQPPGNIVSIQHPKLVCCVCVCVCAWTGKASVNEQLGLGVFCSAGLISLLTSYEYHYLFGYC